MITAIIGTIIIRSLYHKMFDVVYFSFSAYVKEILVIFCVCMFIAQEAGLP